MAADASGPERSEIPEISPTDLNTRLQAGEKLVLVDVREPFEKEIADLPDYGQVRIPMAEIGQRINELDASQPTVVYCRSGGRSGQVLLFLQHKGFSQILNLAGGVLGWREDVDPTLTAY